MEAAMKADTQMTRRSFVVKSGAAAAALTVVGRTALHLGSVSAASLYVRRNVGGMNAFDPVINAYSKAVKAMQALPASDPRNWAYQAAIHGTFTTPVQTAWNTCQHGN